MSPNANALSVQPCNGHFLGTQNIGFHWVHQLPAFHFQLFSRESSDICCSCRLRLLLKTEVNTCSAVIEHRKVYHTVMLSRTSKLPPETPEKRKLPYPLISRKCLAADLCQPGSVSCVFVLVCCLFVQCLQQRIDVVTICTQLHIFLQTCMVASISVSNGNDAQWLRHPNMGHLTTATEIVLCSPLASWAFWSIGGSAVATCNLICVLTLFPLGPPGPPGVVIVEEITDTTATLSWTCALDNHSPISTYNLQARSPFSLGWQTVKTGNQ